MNKESKTLPQAIKIVVGIYGKKVVNDVQMVNIMNDVVSLEDPNAVKTILRDCIKMGYGGKILLMSPKDDYHIKIKSFSKQLSDSHGYKEVIVQYILYSIAYGIGVCPKEPYLKNIETPKSPQKIIKKPKTEEHIANLEEESGLPWGKIGIVAVLLIAVVYGVNYWTSSTQKEEFENRIFAGNNFLNSGDYDKAVESYKDAYNGYTSLNSTSYKKDALKKIDNITEKLLKDAQTDNKSLLQSYKVLQSELQLDLETNDREMVQAKLEKIETLITEKTENGRNTLITNLSANNGKLDEASLVLLGELLELAPDDYWLNFIKKKSNE